MFSKIHRTVNIVLIFTHRTSGRCLKETPTDGNTVHPTVLHAIIICTELHAQNALFTHRNAPWPTSTLFTVYTTGAAQFYYVLRRRSDGCEDDNVVEAVCTGR
jgi:hypothetical protein